MVSVEGVLRGRVHIHGQTTGMVSGEGVLKEGLFLDRDVFYKGFHCIIKIMSFIRGSTA